MARKKGSKNVKAQSTGTERKPSAKGIRGFVLREDVDSMKNGSEREEDVNRKARESYGTDVDLLMSEFGGLGLEVVSTVLDNQEGNLERAWGFLQQLAEMNIQEGHERSLEITDYLENGASTSDNASHGGCAEATSRMQSPWDMLPEDCKRIIWNFLPMKDRHRAAATSREWYQYSKESLSWNSFVSVNRNMSTNSIRSMISSHNQSNKIKFDYREHIIGSVLWRDPETFYKMVRLGEDDRWDDEYVDSVDINTVMVHGSESFTREELECLLENMEYMENLSLYNCPQIGDDDVEALSLYQGQICRTDDESEAMHNSRPLSSLSMQGTKLTNKGLKILVGNSGPYRNELMHLDVSGSKFLTELEPPVHATFLRSLTAKKCPNIKKVDLKIANSFFSKLELQTCRNLKEVCLGGGLRHLHVSGCKQLQTLSLDCPRLEQLQAAACSQLKLTGPYISTLHLPNLEHLNINGCREVDDEGLSLLLRKITKGLKTLNIGGCIRLTDVNVKFQAVEGCVLDCYGCSKLKSLNVQSPSPLERLVVSGCRRLANLIIVGNKPISLHCEHCESLRGVM